MAKKIVLATEVVAANIIAKANYLVKQREDFEKNEFARSNQRLYQILAEVLEMYLEASKNKKLLKDSVALLKSALTADNVRVQTNTLALTLFVRYVFRTDRQRSLNYSRTLQAAIQQGVGAKQLAQFIEDCGGVESCKKQFTKSAIVMAKETTIANNLTFVEEALTNAEESPLASFKVAESLVAKTYDKGYVFLIGKADKKGGIKALNVVPAYSAGMTKWAKQQLALFLAEQQVEAEKQAKGKRKENALAKAKSALQSKTPTVTVGELLAA